MSSIAKYVTDPEIKAILKKKDEDKEEKENPSAGLCALIYSTPLSSPFNVMAV